MRSRRSFVVVGDVGDVIPGGGDARCGEAEALRDDV